MARGYRWLSPADEDEIWARLRAGHAAKPTARALGLTTGGVLSPLISRTRSTIASMFRTLDARDANRAELLPIHPWGLKSLWKTPNDCASA